MIYASTFLSYSSTDHLLVKAVACELGHWGIVPWLDKNELNPGESLRKALSEAIRKQETVTLFLSKDSVVSSWVQEELAVALEMEESMDHKDRIIPVFIGAPLELVNASDVLRKRWLDSDGTTVDRLGVAVDPNKDISILANDIAREIAQKIYKVLNIKDRREIVLCIDQRGNGKRTGIPPFIPDNVESMDIPALVFRHDIEERDPGETLYGEKWDQTHGKIKNALCCALDGTRWKDFKKIRLIGNAQLGLAYVLGNYFNRNTSAHLYCMNMDGVVFNNKDQRRDCPLEGGNAHCESTHARIQPIQTGSQLNAISLLLSSKYLVTKLSRYLNAVKDAPPLVWVENPRFTNNGQVMQYISDIVALLMRYSEEYDIRTVHLYCGLPFHVIPLLAANLLHVIDNVIFMEFRRDLQDTSAADEDMYVALSI